MHPDPRVEEFCQSYARCGSLQRAAEAAGCEGNGLIFQGQSLLFAPGARARLREIYVEIGKQALQDRTALVGKLDALFERVFASHDPGAAAKILALQVRVARDLAALERETKRGAGRAATQFRPAPQKRALLPGKSLKPVVESQAFDSEDENAKTVASENGPQAVESAPQSS